MSWLDRLLSVRHSPIGRQSASASGTAEHEILVVRRFEEAPERSTKHGVRLRHVIGRPQPRLQQAALRESVVVVAAHAEIERPLAESDGVLRVDGLFAYITVTDKVKQ